MGVRQVGDLETSPTMKKGLDLIPFSVYRLWGRYEFRHYFTLFDTNDPEGSLCPDIHNPSLLNYFCESLPLITVPIHTYWCLPSIDVTEGSSHPGPLTSRKEDDSSHMFELRSRLTEVRYFFSEDNPKRERRFVYDSFT